MGNLMRLPVDRVLQYINEGGILREGTNVFSLRATNVSILGPDKLPVGGIQSIAQITETRTLTPNRQLDSVTGGRIFEWIPSPTQPIQLQLSGFLVAPDTINQYHQDMIARIQGPGIVEDIRVSDLNAWLSPLDIGIRFELPDNAGYMIYWYVGCMPVSRTISGIDVIGGNNAIQEQLTLQAMWQAMEWKV